MSETFADTGPELLRVHAGDRLALISDSYQRLTGRTLTGHTIAPHTDTASALWSLPQVVLAHGTGDDPVFFYGNRQALQVFELTPEQLIRMPSRLSAEALLREEREALLQRVARHGFIDDYQGIRISASGQRFWIRQATVWNLLDAHGHLHGQAATFANWEMI